MVDAGILRFDDRVELIEGEIIEMSPIGNRHAACVDRASELFTLAFKGRAIVSIQNPLRLNEYNEPQSGIVLLKRREDYYATRSRTPEDTFLVVEVSDATLPYDTGVKVPMYARAGVPETWIENLTEDLLLVFRDPTDEAYKTHLTLRRSDSISPLAFPDSAFAVAQLLG
jgi:Uma2 family endonuclease